MHVDEVKELQKGITDILVAIGKIETEIKQLSNLSNKVDEATITVIRLERDLEAAHKKIDDLSVKVESLDRKIESDKRMARDDRKWVWGFVVGAAALVWKLIETLQNGGK